MTKRVVFCNCQGKLVKPERLAEITSYLNGQGISFTQLTDLCGLSATRKDEVKALFSDDFETLMIACYPRTVKLLLDEAGIDTGIKQVTTLNMREAGNEELTEQIRAFSDSEPLRSSVAALSSDPEWPSWYPVIDYSRCTACGQCADFCLFGVYEKQQGKIVVVHPHDCKNKCPACARICPQTAIVFPKYEHGGAIAGADSIDETAEHQRQQQDINAILGSDIYQSLERRKLRRNSIIRESEMQKAVLERDRAVKGEN